MKRRKLISLLLVLGLGIFCLSGCGKTQASAEAEAEAIEKASEETEKPAEDTSDTDTPEEAEAVDSEEEETETAFVSESPDWLVPAENPVSLGDLECIGQMRLDYAEQFRVYYYEGGYKVISLTDSDDYLILPEGADLPEYQEELVVLQQPLDHIYLQATAAMALFRAIHGLDHIKLVGTDAGGWYIEEAVEAIENGDMIFAGKYSEPDYEILAGGECNLAIESTMIYHVPKVKEMLENLGMPVFVEYSAFEPQALGRTEWVKVYGAMLNKEAEAYEFFEKQGEIVEEIAQCEKTDRTVVYFYVSSDRTIVVPNDSTYTVGMIEEAGGNYVFSGLQEDVDSATVTLSMESFYDQALDADYFIYNSSIDSPLTSIQDLLAKDPLFADFKAVQEGNVWCTGKSLFQSTDRLAYMIQDVHKILTEEDPKDLTFLSKVE